MIGCLVTQINFEEFKQTCMMLFRERVVLVLIAWESIVKVILDEHSDLWHKLMATLGSVFHIRQRYSYTVCGICAILANIHVLYKYNYQLASTALQILTAWPHLSTLPILYNTYCTHCTYKSSNSDHHIAVSMLRWFLNKRAQH